MGTSQFDRDSYVTSFLKYLDFERAPRGFSQAHSTAERAEETSSGRLFVENGGFQTWLAYYLTNRAADPKNRHFQDQAKLAQQLRTFEEEPVEFRISVAKGVKESLPLHIKKKFQNLLNKPRKRQRRCFSHLSFLANLRQVR